MKAFQYATALSTASARELVGDKGAYLAGGNDLLGLLKEYLVSAETLVNIKSLPGLGKIEHGKNFWTIGALVTVAQIELDADIKKAVAAKLKSDGYPTSADTTKMDKVMVILILTYLVVLVTMVYGPIAAMLVEMFPTRIRYTSMSLPYHIGNGWFGGLLPTTAFAIVAQTGNMYNGLWYPIIIAGTTFVIGTIFIKETKDLDIYAKD